LGNWKIPKGLENSVIPGLKREVEETGDGRHPNAYFHANENLGRSKTELYFVKKRISEMGSSVK